MDYYRLVKPGIVYSNALITLAAFLFASIGTNWVQLAATVLGISFSMAGACVFNNILDRDIDARMERTRARALVEGRISLRSAFLFGTFLMAIGLSLLAAFTNGLVLLIVGIGTIIYLALYTPAKRYTRHSTIIGAVSGAVPPLAGYAAATGRLDLIAVSLALVLICWQMAHFMSIALFRMEEYQAAGLPIMPVSCGIRMTTLLALIYTVLFSYALYALWHAAGMGYASLAIWCVVSVCWIALALYGCITKDTKRWARRMFWYSLIALLAFALVIALS